MDSLITNNMINYVAMMVPNGDPDDPAGYYCDGVVSYDNSDEPREMVLRDDFVNGDTSDHKRWISNFFKAIRLSAAWAIPVPIDLGQEELNRPFEIVVEAAVNLAPSLDQAVLDVYSEFPDLDVPAEMVAHDILIQTIISAINHHALKGRHLQ